MSKLPQGETLLFSALVNERGVLATLIVTQVVATILAFAPVLGVAFNHLLTRATKNIPAYTYL